MNRDIHVRLCERLGAKSPGRLGGRWVTAAPMPINRLIASTEAT
jgi:hypothetical protein